MKDQKKGFTLVELSIVLVIIGLLIGGILVGQSLIESAKMQSFIRQMQQYDAAVAQFKSKFRQLPGDASVFGCVDNTDTSGNVCNDGEIGALVNTGQIIFSAETARFWEHLSNSGFKPNNESFSSTIPASTIVTLGENVPEASIGDGAGVAAYENAYYVGSYVALGAINVEPGLSAVDSLAFDAKIDDGAADAGEVQVGLDAASTDCNTADVYNVDSGSDAVCTISIEMLSGTNF